MRSQAEWLQRATLQGKVSRSVCYYILAALLVRDQVCYSLLPPF